MYVLEDYGLSNALILDKACRQAGLPSPLVPLAGDPTGRKRAYLALSRRSSSNSLIPEQRGAKTHSDSLAKVLQAHRVRDDLTCTWCRCRSSSAARRTSRAAGSRCCSRKTGRWSAASAACWACC